MNFENKQLQLKKLFTTCSSPAEKYQQIIALGKTLPELDPVYKIPENIVPGCQSRLYLHAELQAEQMLFQADADALISKGLAALLIKIYNGETPETVLKCPPTVLQELGIISSLSPTRSQGLQNLYLKMKQVALYFLTLT